MGRRWGKIEKDFYTKQKRFDISKIPDIYDCIKYDLQHNNHTLQFEHAEELYIYSKYLADIVIPQEYGLTVQEKLTIGQGICTPLLKKIRADLQRNIEEPGEESVNRLNPRYSHGVSSPGRHVRTRLYFTSESHVHSLLTVLRYGGLLDVISDEQWRRAMEYVSMVSELNYMSQIVVMLYEDPTKDPSSEERFHVELHFSPGVNCCVQKNLPPGPGFRPHSRNESNKNHSETSPNQGNTSQYGTRIDEEDIELNIFEDDVLVPICDLVNISSTAVEVGITNLTLDMPTPSKTIDMMNLDPFIMDEPYDSGFLQTSAPIPISARTVAGHEASRLGSQLAASQRQSRERESGICEQRAKSYDYQRQKKSDETKRHRHSISGQMNYFKLMGYNINKKLTGSTNSLFSTAVISGSSSAPNLKDMVQHHASAIAAIEGFGGVPPIRPLETLHNALSLRQLDSFLEAMTITPMFRTPASSPPKVSPVSIADGQQQNLIAIDSIRYVTAMSIHSKETMFNSELNDIKHHISPTSPTSITWSSESFISSEPSSPSLNSAGKYSIPIRLASTDRSQVPPSSQVKYSINHGHEFDYVEYCMRIEQETRESRGSVSYTDYYSNEDGQIRRSVNDNCLPLFVKPVYCATSSTEHSCRNKGDVNHDFSGDHITTCINEIKDEGNHDAYNNKDRTLIFEQSEDTRHDVQYAFKQPNNKSSINYKRIDFVFKVWILLTAMCVLEKLVDLIRAYF
ncbi:inositol hexakisphosphate and diphosphoinositol-pentakisphosphate kinase-like isoform X2 [Phymastichus coffea]|uniref:inositol hexakisphosphate and diphosphoinositol-pentakisphosphate kinase-like isoform X2 n=1 Tax=Phymastichus coffea TaxID=108790 RepID=UPI00273BD6E1|nr:inositol hexakisphosphate and diphosphoinositol-pentakisphosphate kinase-like isoform X2 [Phymastichus coffea]